MKSLSSLRLAKAAAIVGLAGLSFLATEADPDAKKPEKRVPPTGAQLGEIPAGVDSGTPVTSNSMQLGMQILRSGFRPKTASLRYAPCSII